MAEKALVVQPTGTGLYVIKYTGGGEVPQALSGKYTSYATANDAIALFQGSVQASPHIKYPKQRGKASEESAA